MSTIKRHSDIPQEWSKDQVSSSLLLEDRQNENDHNEER